MLVGNTLVKQQEIIELIFDVPLGNSSWEDVAEELRDTFDAILCLIMIIRPNQAPTVVISKSADKSQLASYGDYYHTIDPWNDCLDINRRPANIFYPTSVMMDDKEFFKTEYFNDFWKPYGLYYSCGALLKTKNNISAIVGLPREKQCGPYSKSEAQQLTFFGRQITRALDLEGFFGDSLPNNVYEHALASSFGLTNAESKLVIELFKCGSLPEVSKQLSRSYHTVRNQMKSVLNKTEARNQIELFAKLVKN